MTQLDLNIPDPKRFVVHCTRAEYDVYVGRGSDPRTGELGSWGNPFSALPWSQAEFRVRSRDEAISSYRKWLLAQPELVERVKRELKGKVLGCWCAPKRCHADILVEIANAV